MSDWSGDARLIGGRGRDGIVEVRIESFDLPDDVPVGVLLAKGDKFERRFGGDRRRLVCTTGVLELARAHVVAERFDVSSVLSLGTPELRYEFTLQFAVDPSDSANAKTIARAILGDHCGRLEVRSMQFELELDARGAKALHKMRAMVQRGELLKVTVNNA